MIIHVIDQTSHIIVTLLIKCHIILSCHLINDVIISREFFGFQFHNIFVNQKWEWHDNCKTVSKLDFLVWEKENQRVLGFCLFVSWSIFSSQRRLVGHQLAPNLLCNVPSFCFWNVVENRMSKRLRKVFFSLFSFSSDSKKSYKKREQFFFFF